jgi:hypothetical protein
LVARNLIKQIKQTINQKPLTPSSPKKAPARKCQIMGIKKYFTFIHTKSRNKNLK